MEPRRSRPIAAPATEILDGLFILQRSAFQDPISGIIGPGDTDYLEVHPRKFNAFLRELKMLLRLRRKSRKGSALESDRRRKELREFEEMFRARYESAMESLYKIDQPYFLKKKCVFVNASLFRTADRHFLWAFASVISELERELRPDEFYPALKKGPRQGSSYFNAETIEKICALAHAGKKPAAIQQELRLDTTESVRRQVERAIKSHLPFFKHSNRKTR